MSISPIEFPSISSGINTIGSTARTTDLGAAAGPSGPTGPGSDFGSMLVKGIDSLEGMTDKAADLSVKAATGDLTNIHDYTIAASEAQLATQLTVAVRDKAVAAFQQIMTMQI